MGFKTVLKNCDILVVGGGMGGTGAAYEARHWGRDMRIVVAEKANIDRSGAVAQGLYAINCYMGMQWDENQPEDHVPTPAMTSWEWFAKILPMTWHVMLTRPSTSLRSGAFPSCETRKPVAINARVNGRS